MSLPSDIVQLFGTSSVPVIVGGSVLGVFELGERFASQRAKDALSKWLLTFDVQKAKAFPAKGGIESVHPLHGPELRALRPLQGNSPYVFTTEAGTPVTPAWFLRMVQRTGKAARLPFPVHPHMRDTQRDTNSPIRAKILGRWRYTALAPDRFAKFWQD